MANKLFSTDKIPQALIVRQAPLSNFNLFLKDFMKGIICSKHGCGVCEWCKKIDEGKYFDLCIYNGKEMKKSEAVDSMTRFSLPGIEKCNIRIYVIKNIEYANKSILNSLLKFVEEPPAGVYAVFTTKNYNAIIPTIRSRCFCFYLEKDEKTVNNFLNSKDISMNEKNLIKKCFYEFEDLKNNFDKVINFLDLIKKLASSDRLVYANQILSLFRKMEYSDINLFMEICKNVYPSIANKIIQLQDNLNLNSPRVLIYNQIYDLLGEVNK